MSNKQRRISLFGKKILSVLILAASYALIYTVVYFSYAAGKQVAGAWAYAALLFLLCAGSALHTLYGSRGALSLRKCGALASSAMVCVFLMVVFSQLLKLPYLAPYALCGLIATVLSDSKEGFFTNLSAVLAFFAAQLLFSQTPGPELYYPLFGGVYGGVVASFMSGKSSNRMRYVTVGTELSVFALLFAAADKFAFGGFSGAGLWLDLVMAALSGILSVMFMFILVPLFERVFNLTTDFRLSEITSTSQPLLKRLFEEAPGTFNHSLIVANYTEACAAAIGESTFLARAAAYYHDIGKLKNPNYFVENLSGGANPHDELTPEASVIAIKKHVAHGIALARENRLPSEVQRAIIEHHGTMPIKFFYLKAKKYTDGDLPYDDYRYDGPTPTSKINGILMIADACEAALRASPREDPAKVVGNIVTERMEFNQFAECDLTMRELDIIKSTILSTYMGIRHDRIKYPKAKLINAEKDQTTK